MGSYDFRPWVKPAVAIMVGLILLSDSDTITPYLAWIAALVMILTGIGQLVQFFSRKCRDIGRLLDAIILLPLGFYVALADKNPESRASLAMGVLLILQAIRVYAASTIPQGRFLALAMAAVGMALLAMPYFAPLALAWVCGLVALAVGLGMVIKQLHDSGKSHTEQKLTHKTRTSKLRSPNGTRLIDSRQE